MNQTEVERAVARATGESRRFIKWFGFSLIAEAPVQYLDSTLAIDCPGCGAFLTPDSVSNCRELECPRCDAIYPVAADELYVIDSPSAAPVACT